VPQSDQEGKGRERGGRTELHHFLLLSKKGNIKKKKKKTLGRLPSLERRGKKRERLAIHRKKGKGEEGGRGA